ncbi:UNVERIFIED_CONTAM: hypothetical protein NY603_37645, partial [Bacteroidetes bacterium 56_B9]
MGWYITPDSWIDVFKPGSTNVGILLQDCQINARYFSWQQSSVSDACQASSDDSNFELADFIDWVLG